MARPSKPLSERFWDKVNKNTPNGCWEWVAQKNWAGYGLVWNGTKVVRAHRVAYELLIGPLTKGLDPDHLCRNRCCVNPAHIEQVTRSENLRRGNMREGANRSAARTHCPKGHPYSEENTSRKKTTKARRCLTCHRIEEQSRRKRATNG